MAKNMFYGFLLNMWVFGKLDEEGLSNYVPRFISEEEKKQIMATPQESSK